MKATGIVRRIDDLGRIVIPKEIRRTMKIREGDSLEIYTDRDGEVIFKKYSPMGEFSQFAAQLCETLNRISELDIAVTDRDSVIAAAGSCRRDIIDKNISDDLERVMEMRQIYQYRKGYGDLKLSENYKKSVILAAPILSGGDVSGCVVILSDENTEPDDNIYKMSQLISIFLAKQLED